MDSLANTFRIALELSEEGRIAMGHRGKELIRNNYSIEVIATKMKQLYEYLLYGGVKPNFVYL